MEYVIDEKIRVSNNSWGNSVFSQSLYDAIQASQVVGHIFVASAGNTSENIDVYPHYPASFALPNVISVAATDNRDNLAVFPSGNTSCYGPAAVDLGAPGLYVYSTINEGLYGYMSGTSMAAPHVTGVVALLTSRRPDYLWSDIKDRILAGARPVDSLIGITVTGGILNAKNVGDCNGNGLADEIDIASATSEDCSENGIPDECERDCNSNGAADSCDILTGTATDANMNMIPDSCELDCNGNGEPDSWDLAEGGSEDCNQNLVPDECDLTNGTAADCNYNSVPDSCDLEQQTSTDCDENSVPDECESVQDCNANGFWDACDLSWKLSLDCDEDGVPDECFNSADECNGNGIPDACEADCNENQVPDECDLFDGTSEDCTGNGVPDECEPDCNENGTADTCDIASGTSFDVNGNSVPDECQVIIFVDKKATGLGDGSSWTDAFVELRDALIYSADPSNGVSEIWLAAGTYTPDVPDGNRDASFYLVNGVTIYGGFAGGEVELNQRDPELNITTLSGDLNGDDEPREAGFESDCCEEHDGPGCDNDACEALVCAVDSSCCSDQVWELDWCVVRATELCCGICGFKHNVCDNSHHVVTADDLETVAVLDGLTITGGNATGIGNGGGGLDSGRSEVIARSCVFKENSGDLGGGVNSYSSNLTFIDCVFDGNRAHRYGGAIYAIGNSVTFTGCTFTANQTGWMGGALSLSSSDANVVNCMFLGNRSGLGGGAIYSSSAKTVSASNSVFSGNSAGSVGGAVGFGSQMSVTITNCSFVGNNAASSGGGVYGRIGAINNCILWGNTSGTGTGESAQLYSGASVINYSCVEGWTGLIAGVGNTGEAPVFADYDGPDNMVGTEDDDLRLLVNSPCIDAGNNMSVPHWMTSDLAGSPRFIEVPTSAGSGNGTPPIVDMGAYEYGSDCNENKVSDEYELSQGLSEDCDDDRVPDECEADGDDDGVPDECDQCMGYDDSSDADMDGVPDACDECPYEPFLDEPAEPGYEITCDDGIDNDCDEVIDGNDPDCACEVAGSPLVDPGTLRKVRYLSFTEANPDVPTAVRVSFTHLPAPFDVINGETMWVGPIREVSENSGCVDPADAPGWPTFRTATLQCEPHYAFWGSVGVHIYHEFIVPGGTYELHAIAPACDTWAEEDYSPASESDNSIWGDIVSDCTTAPCGSPDGVVNITTDVTAVLDKWKNIPGSVAKARADLEGAPAGDPRVPDQTINITDVTRCLGAFLGESYPPPDFPVASSPPVCP